MDADGGWGNAKLVLYGHGAFFVFVWRLIGTTNTLKGCRSIYHLFLERFKSFKSFHLLKRVRDKLVNVCSC